MDINELQDRVSLRELIDTVSILGDRKDFNAQVQLFTEDAVSETFAEEASILKLKGRKEMAEAFDDFLKDFETVYHFNGQQVLTIDGDEALGTCYCQVTLIGQENGKKIKTTIGAIYKDNYIRMGNQWLISKRVGTFDWQDKTEV
ncbi:bile acid 7-alpha-dehydratase [Mucilaginibacter sp. PAMC 26640]|nr:bile acid 7-alpha-dehydratase [Mucilaginibacter sp. PAMC 26640]